MKITALIGKRIKILRLERGLTQGDIEEATGVSRSHISKIESGKVANPGLDTLEKIAKALKVSISFLFHFDERTLKKRVQAMEKQKKEHKREMELLESKEQEIKKLKRELKTFKKKK
ncbi:MAG: helix-turn-helix transcriptional regulator [Candidatus Aminicenantaceae bacterium]